MKKTKIGFLPFYIKLYDDRMPERHDAMQNYSNEIAAKIKEQDVDVVIADICRIKPEFEAAVKLFEAEKVDAIVTFHIAYSPSLESIDALAGTDLPIVILDTTRDYQFNFTVVKGATSYDHGIHGVQDFCNLLKRRGKEYSIFTGHYLESDVVKRAVDAVRAIKAAKSLKGSKVGRIGGSFEGMGDFVPTAEALDRLGVTVLECDGEELGALQATVTEEEVQAEYKEDCENSGASALTYDQYAFASRVGLGVRKWIAKNELDAFTMTFLTAGQVKGFETMPFSEACKEMAFGVGYAGEGDILTASVVGAFMKAFDKVNFTEMFCPNWKDSEIYMSHMGECNLKLMESRRTLLKPFPYADSPDPACILGHMVAGQACIVNMLPNAEGWFDIVIAEGEMMQLPEYLENFATSMNGWFKPKKEVAAFLEEYSTLGATHHSALIYDVDAKSLALFAKTLGMKYTII